MNKQTIKKIGIFGGTQEGRLLAEFCRDEDIDFTISVANPLCLHNHQNKISAAAARKNRGKFFGCFSPVLGFLL